MNDQSKEDLNKRMEEMRKKNELLMKRRVEVLADQRQAEESGASITNILKTQKGGARHESSDSDIEEKKTSSHPNIHERAWDKGKKIGVDVEYEENENPYEQGGWNSWKSYNRDKKRGRGNFRQTYHDNTMRGYKQGYSSASKPEKTFISTSTKQESYGSYAGKEWKPKSGGDSRTQSWQSRNQRPRNNSKMQTRGRGKCDNERYYHPDVNQPFSRQSINRQAGGSWRKKYEDQSSAQWNTVQETQSSFWHGNEAIKGQSNAWSDLSDSENSHVPDLKMQKFLSDVEKYSNLGNDDKGIADDRERASSYETENEGNPNLAAQVQKDLEKRIENEVLNSVEDFKVMPQSNLDTAEMKDRKIESLHETEDSTSLSNFGRRYKNDNNYGAALDDDSDYCYPSQVLPKENCSIKEEKHRVESGFLSEKTTFQKLSSFKMPLIEKENDVQQSQQEMIQKVDFESETESQLPNIRDAWPKDVESIQVDKNVSLYTSEKNSDCDANEIPSTDSTQPGSSFNIKNSSSGPEKFEQTMHSCNQEDMKDWEVPSIMVGDNTRSVETLNLTRFIQGSEEDSDNNKLKHGLKISQVTDTLSSLPCAIDSTPSDAVCNYSPDIVDSTTHDDLPDVDSTADDVVDSTTHDDLPDVDSTADDVVDSTTDDVVDSTTHGDSPGVVNSTTDDVVDSTTHDDSPDVVNSTTDDVVDSTIGDAEDSMYKACHNLVAAGATTCDVSDELDSTFKVVHTLGVTDSTPCTFDAINSASCDTAKAEQFVLGNSSKVSSSTFCKTSDEAGSAVHHVSEIVNSVSSDALPIKSFRVSSPTACDVANQFKNVLSLGDDTPLPKEIDAGIIDEGVEKLNCEKDELSSEAGSPEDPGFSRKDSYYDDVDYFLEKKNKPQD